MLTSPNSEDWVSWTVFRTLARQPNSWPALLGVADLSGAGRALATGPAPTLRLWSSFPPPAACERASRARMGVSLDAAVRQRAAGRRAWMSLVVLDRAPERAHTQLVARYRADPGALHALLPHRTRAEIDAVVRDLRVILWRDLLPLLGVIEPPALQAELARRCRA